MKLGFFIIMFLSKMNKKNEYKVEVSTNDT